MQKVCKGCGETKDVSEFGAHKAMKDGLRTKCKPCNNSEAKSYKAENKDKRDAYQREYYRKHYERVSAQNRAWARNNREKRAEYLRWRRSVKKYYADLGYDTPTLDALHALYGKICLHPDCDQPSDTIDHVVPLSRGGEHSMANAQPLCMTHNSTKHTKTTDYRKVDKP